MSICQSTLDEPARAHGLTLRKVRKIGHRKDIEGFFGEALPGKVSPTSPTYLAAPLPPQQAKKTNRASMSSVMSALGVTLGQHPAPTAEPTPAAAPPVVKSPSSGSFLASRGKKMYNFFGHRPPSELISTHLADYFPAAKRKDLERGYRNSMLRIGDGATTTTTANATPGVSNRASYASSRTSSIEQNALPSRFSVASSTSSGERAAATRTADVPRVSVSDDTITTSAGGSSEHVATQTSRPASILSTKSRRRKSHMIPGRGDRRQSATPSMLTGDEITAEFEQRRASVMMFAESEQEAEEAAARFGSGAGVGPGGGGTAHRLSKAYPGGLPPQPESEEEDWDQESFEESDEDDSEEEESEESEEEEEEEEEVEDEQGKAFTSTGGEHAAFRPRSPMLTPSQTSARSNGSRAP